MIHKTQKFNMKSERRAYREIYAFYFFCLFLKKVIKKLLTFCYWSHNKEHIEQAALRIPAGRVMINQPATNGSGRQNNGLGQTVSLGCGYWGGNGVSHNVNFKDMLNYTTVSAILEDRKVLTPEEIMEDVMKD